LLFVKFVGRGYPIRIDRRAAILDDAESLARHHAAKVVMCVQCELFSNGPRSVHDVKEGRLQEQPSPPGMNRRPRNGRGGTTFATSCRKRSASPAVRAELRALWRFWRRPEPGARFRLVFPRPIHYLPVMLRCSKNHRPNIGGDPEPQRTPRMSSATKTIEAAHAEMSAGMQKAMIGAGDFLAFGQGNLDAFMKSSQIWAAGVQELCKHVAATAQSGLQETLASFQALSGVKSPNEALDIQVSLARANLGKVVAETGKITDTSLKLAEQAMAPITARMAQAAEKFAKAG